MKTSHKVRIIGAVGLLGVGAYLFGSTGVINTAMLEEGRRYVVGEMSLPSDVEGMSSAVNKATDYCKGVFVVIDVPDPSTISEADAAAAAKCVYFFSSLNQELDNIIAERSSALKDGKLP